MSDVEDLVGRYHVERASAFRRMMIDAFDAVPSGHPMLALVELDVTAAQAAVETARAAGERVSLFAVVVGTIARALAEHPELNVIRDGVRVVRFEDVDVNIPMEVETPHGPRPYQLVVRRASEKSSRAIYGELEEARRTYASQGALGAEDRFVRRLLPLYGFVPGFVRRWIVRRMASDPITVKRRFGTTVITSVGKAAALPGFVIPFTGGPRAAIFALGSVVEKPAVRAGQIAIRSFLSLTIVIDHDLVDGAPAARFARRLQELLETAAA